MIRGVGGGQKGPAILADTDCIYVYYGVLSAAKTNSNKKQAYLEKVASYLTTQHAGCFIEIYCFIEPSFEIPLCHLVNVK